MKTKQRLPQSFFCKQQNGLLPAPPVSPSFSLSSSLSLSLFLYLSYISLFSLLCLSPLSLFFSFPCSFSALLCLMNLPDPLPQDGSLLMGPQLKIQLQEFSLFQAVTVCPCPEQVFLRYTSLVMAGEDYITKCAFWKCLLVVIPSFHRKESQFYYD